MYLFFDTETTGIPPDATRVHGITTERAAREGVALKEALLVFDAAARAAARAIAHNLGFDEKVLGRSRARTTPSATRRPARAASSSCAAAGCSSMTPASTRFDEKGGTP